ncbi:CPBP family intramembrane glutamic endopeptidase [Thiocystis violacea]|uniref:CPBP family intramembrane glutamic endopeptidase n=1 Tax=Thiocystis violacea TaxID=13725 RepID=UPI0019035A0A|nr:CPBP family intramembrane glutamic endopeptidase [Thiocystis violacea]MBK1718804.1 CPBP family intramembrane metalloprotease domain-containing protein [Thiocystis violacea]
MRPTLQFFAYLLVCLVLAAVLTPPLMASGWIEVEPQRLMGRLAQLLMLVGIWPFLSWQGLTNRAALGYGPSWPDWRRAVVGGWVLGVLILLALVMALLALEIRLPEARPDPWTSLVAKSVQALIGGLLIGGLEETFFRGALYSGIRRRNGLASAVVWSAALYAVLHFMKPGALPETMVLDWSGSLWMFAHVFIDLFQWKHLDSMVALFVVGVFLALVRERTGHIGWCVGLHAGWVLVIQVTRKVTDGNDEASLAFLAGAYDGTIGWLAAIWIAALTGVYWIWSGRRRGSG